MKFIILICAIFVGCSGVPLNKPSTNPFKLPESKYQLNHDGKEVPQSGNPFGRGVNQLQAVPPNDDGSKYTQQEGLTKDGYSRVINHDQKLLNNGDYQYIYKTDNGISAHEVGKLKIFSEDDAGSQAQGQYSYTAPDGQVITVQYTADENGFQPVGEHLPTPPPIPEHVVRLLAYLAAHAEKDEKSGKKF